MYKRQNPSSNGRKRPLTIGAEPEFKMMYMNKIKVYLPAALDLYPTQKLMINRILKAVGEKENALIEAPTGSGKTLALLSSTCSWLSDYEEKRREKRDPCPIHSAVLDETNETAIGMDEKVESMLKMETSVNADFKEPLERNSRVEDKSVDQSNVCTCRPKIRIYYCTRTHKQISQVVKEYKRLPFWRNETLKHTILASREQTCVNMNIRGLGSDLNANCKHILEPKNIGCAYKDELKSLTSGKERFSVRNKMQSSNLYVWDIEDLINKLPKINMNVCPYFLTTRELTKDANLIFCPFNYLVDPIIRGNSDVYLKNSIIILDEAHNIEDVCRNSASFSFDDMEISLALQNLITKGQEVLKHKHQPSLKIVDLNAPLDYDVLDEYSESINEWYLYLKKFSTLFADFVHGVVENLKPDQYTNSRVKNLDWKELNIFLKDVYLSVDSDDYKHYLRSFNGLLPKGGGGDSENNSINVITDSGLRLHSSTIVCIEKILFFFKFYSRDENRTLYKGNIEVSLKHQSFVVDSNVELPKALIVGHTCHLNFWSMLPSIAFNEAFSECHSIILASGTLLPMDTGELGIPFKNQMEGQQIIDNDRIFATALSRGPNNRGLRLTYANMNPEMMLELATIIYDVCETVPHGVLVFLSSYRILQNLKQAFQQSGLQRKLQKIKEIFYEPKVSSEMNSFLSEYEKAVKIRRKKCTGAVMFAVFRGKVSEGLDFADDRARAVITIGIPYPSIADQNIAQKRSFNDMNAKNINIVSGSEWYETQAYRALNQALGRCLRHKKDYGALIMIDERCTPRQTKISGWIRQQMKGYPTYKAFRENLQQFMDRRIAIALEEEEAETSVEIIKEVFYDSPVSRDYKNPVFK